MILEFIFVIFGVLNNFFFSILKNDGNLIIFKKINRLLYKLVIIVIKIMYFCFRIYFFLRKFLFFRVFLLF